MCIYWIYCASICILCTVCIYIYSWKHQPKAISVNETLLLLVVIWIVLRWYLWVWGEKNPPAIWWKSTRLQEVSWPVERFHLHGLGISRCFEKQSATKWFRWHDHPLCQVSLEISHLFFQFFENTCAHPPGVGDEHGQHGMFFTFQNTSRANIPPWNQSPCLWDIQKLLLSRLGWKHLPTNG